MLNALRKWLCPFFLSLFLMTGGLAYGASSVLLWPINPVLESDQSATSVWLENRGKQPVTLQIRVLAWTQSDFEDVYAPQKNIVASPPFARIEPGARQFVRLIRQGPLPSQAEDAYRILIDEVPVEPEATPGNQTLGVQFQMRYSLPLFVTAPGIWTQTRQDVSRQPETATKPDLMWSIVNNQGERYLQVENEGRVHARLSKVHWESQSGDVTVHNGLLGYVLAGQTMRWMLSGAMLPRPGMRLMAQLADNTSSIEIRAR